jgi:Spy/CpxP family protein refolding chaperone
MMSAWNCIGFCRMHSREPVLEEDGVRTRSAGRWRRIGMAVAVLLVLSLCNVSAQPAARSRGRGAAPEPADTVSPAEIQRLFDAYVVMQAQQELQLTDEQYPRFLARAKALQDVRRRGQNERQRLVQQLRQLLQQGTFDDAQARVVLKQISDLDTRQVADVRQALEGIDQVLDVRQQAKFRVFEQQMERRQVELLLRARQANRRSQPDAPAAPQQP